jgi:hypothetical protein
VKDKEYIERYAAKEAVWQILNGMGYSEKHNDRLVEEVDAVFDEIPAADVREAVSGKWIDHQQGRWIYAKCSECETVHDVRSNYCPNCGADMRLRESDV